MPVPRGAYWAGLRGPGAVARLHRPRLLFINTALHNPTGTSLEAANAAEVLALAARHDFHIVGTTSRASCWMAGPRRWRDWMARGA